MTMGAPPPRRPTPEELEIKRQESRNPEEQYRRVEEARARQEAQRKADAQAAAIAAKERSAAAKAKTDDEAKARIAAAERARAQEAAIAAKERSAAAKAKADDEAKARIAERERAEKVAAADVAEARESLINAVELAQEAARLQQKPQTLAKLQDIERKVRAGGELNNSEILLLRDLTTEKALQEAQQAGASLALTGAAAGASNRAGIIFALLMTGAMAISAVDKFGLTESDRRELDRLLDKAGFPAPKNATQPAQPIDRPTTPGAVDFGAPQGAEVKTTGIDKQDVKIGTEGIDARPVAGTSASVGLAGELKDLETMDPAEAVREANRIIEEAQRSKAIIAARLKDARARAASPSATPRLREKYAEEARAEREMLEQLDDVETQAKAIRERAVAEDAKTKVASQGTGSETGPKPGAVVSPAPSTTGTGTASSPAETAKPGTEREPTVSTGPEPRGVPKTESKPVDTDQTVSRGKDLTVSDTETGTESPPDDDTGDDRPDDPTDVDDGVGNPPSVTTSTTGAPPPGGSASPPIPPVPFADDEPGGIVGEGEYPREVQWRQGKNYRQFDLNTGQITASRKPKPGGVRAGITPQETLKVIKKSKVRPKIQKFSMGRFIATVGPSNISFSRAAMRMAAPPIGAGAGGNSKPVTGFEESKKKTGFSDGRKSPGFKP